MTDNQLSDSSGVQRGRVSMDDIIYGTFSVIFVVIIFAPLVAIWWYLLAIFQMSPTAACFVGLYVYFVIVWVIGMLWSILTGSYQSSLL